MRFGAVTPVDVVGSVSAHDALSTGHHLPAAMMPLLRAAALPLPERATARICAEVSAFADGHLRSLIHEAVAVAIEGFLRLVSGDDESRPWVDAHFRDIGRSEAGAGERILAAIQVVTDIVWQEVHALAARRELPGDHVADLGVALTQYVVHLWNEVQRGMAGRWQASSDGRARLVTALMQEPAADSLATLAADAGWTPPERAVVVMAQRYGAVVDHRPAFPAATTLSWTDGDRLVTVAPEDAVPEVIEALLLDPRIRIAQSWPVDVLEARHAYRWTRRALAFAQRGLLPTDGRVVRCSRHRFILAVAADQALVDELGRELLAPLRRLTPRRRLALAETLLAWLETDESAPMLARRLSVHANTVRGRMRALRELFGDTLHGPEQRAALIVVLEVTLPRWRAALRGHR